MWVLRVLAVVVPITHWLLRGGKHPFEMLVTIVTALLVAQLLVPIAKIMQRQFDRDHS